MTWKHWLLIAWITLSCLVMIGRTGTTRTYTRWDAVEAAAQGGLLIWLVTTL